MKVGQWKQASEPVASGPIPTAVGLFAGMLGGVGSALFAGVLLLGADRYLPDPRAAAFLGAQNVRLLTDTESAQVRVCKQLGPKACEEAFENVERLPALVKQADGKWGFEWAFFEPWALFALNRRWDAEAEKRRTAP